MPLSGEFNLTLGNEGNIPSIIGYRIDTGDEPDLHMMDRSFDIGEEVSIQIPYDAANIEDSSVMIIEPIGLDGGGPNVEVRVIRDLEFVHLLFQRGPILILSPSSLLGEENGIRIR